MTAREAYSLYVERAVIGRQRSRWALIIALAGPGDPAVEGFPDLREALAEDADGHA